MVALGEEAPPAALLHLQLAQGAYRPGDWVHCTVFLAASKPLPATNLELEVSGYEYTSHEDQGRRHLHDHHAASSGWERRPILLRLLLLLHGSHLGPGQYALPFCFQLPTVDLMPTLVYGKSISITYHVKAHLRAPSLPDPEIHSDQEITILTPPPPLPPLAPPTPAFVSPTEPGAPGALRGPRVSLDVKGALCGLTHAGTVAVEVKEVDSDVVVAGQQVKFVVEVENHSSRDFSHLSVALVQDVSYTCEGDCVRFTQLFGLGTCEPPLPHHEHHRGLHLPGIHHSHDHDHDTAPHTLAFTFTVPDDSAPPPPRIPCSSHGHGHGHAHPDSHGHGHGHNGAEDPPPLGLVPSLETQLVKVEHHWRLSLVRPHGAAVEYPPVPAKVLSRRALLVRGDLGPHVLAMATAAAAAVGANGGGDGGDGGVGRGALACLPATLTTVQALGVKGKWEPQVLPGYLVDLDNAQAIRL